MDGDLHNYMCDVCLFLKPCSNQANQASNNQCLSRCRDGPRFEPLQLGALSSAPLSRESRLETGHQQPPELEPALTKSRPVSAPFAIDTSFDGHERATGEPHGRQERARERQERAPE